MNYFQKVSYKADILNELVNELDNKERGVKLESVRVGEYQATDYKTGELRWEDEAKTIPVMYGQWDTQEKAELTEEDNAKLAIIDEIRKSLTKLV